MSSMKVFFPIAIGMVCLLASCNPTAPAASAPPQSQQQVQPVPNPPAEGFNEANSDPYAITLADEVMEAMGGRKAWDNTRIIQWTFFGSRTLTWDKWEKRARIESHRSDFKAVLIWMIFQGRSGKTGLN